MAADIASRNCAETSVHSIKPAEFADHTVQIHDTLVVTKDSVTILGVTGRIKIDTRTFTVECTGEMSMGEASAKFFDGIAQIRKLLLDKDAQ